MRFLVHNAVGKILRTGSCPEDHIQLQAGIGETAIEGEANDSTDYIVDGVVVTLPVKPSQHHTFNYKTKLWHDPRTPQDHINANRAKRNALLLSCDWTQLPDVPATTQLAWSAYRQALRDITKQPDQRNIVWPVSP